jgi:hypothetical protein
VSTRSSIGNSLSGAAALFLTGPSAVGVLLALPCAGHSLERAVEIVTPVLRRVATNLQTVIFPESLFTRLRVLSLPGANDEQGLPVSRCEATRQSD